MVWEAVVLPLIYARKWWGLLAFLLPLVKRLRGTNTLTYNFGARFALRETRMLVTEALFFEKRRHVSNSENRSEVARKSIASESGTDLDRPVAGTRRFDHRLSTIARALRIRYICPLRRSRTAPCTSRRYRRNARRSRRSPTRDARRPIHRCYRLHCRHRSRSTRPQARRIPKRKTFAFRNSPARVGKTRDRGQGIRGGSGGTTMRGLPGTDSRIKSRSLKVRKRSAFSASAVAR